MADQESPSDLARIRADYQNLFGKKPHHSWDAEDLQKRIVERRMNPPPETAPVPERMAQSGDKATKTIVLVTDHVFLPKDPTQPGWETSDQTVRYIDKDDDGERIKYEVDPGLADFLAKRDQAIVVG